MYTIDNIPEHQANAEITALYTDIKRTLGVPVTNLIWRHLATIEGALANTWEAIRPFYVSGELEFHAAQLRNVENLPNIKRWSIEKMREAGIGKSDVHRLAAVIANYDKSNPANLVALMGLLASIDPVTQSSPVAPLRSPRAVRKYDQELPTLVAESDMPDRVKRRALDFHNLGIDERSTAVIAGVPRHLANWPRLLESAVIALTPYEHPIKLCIANVHAEARLRGIALRPFITKHLCAPIDPRSAVAIRQFIAPEMISNYIVKISLLRKLLPV